MAFSDVIALAALAQLQGPDGANLLVHLYSDPTPVSETTDPTTLVEASFDGYEPLPVRMGDVESSGDGSARSYSAPGDWYKGGDAGRNQTIYSFSVEQLGQPAPRRFLTVRNLDAPVVMNRKGQALELTLGLSLTVNPSGTAYYVVAVEAEIVARRARMSPRLRALLGGLIGSLSHVVSGDRREDDRFEDTGTTRHPVYHNDIALWQASNVVLDRCRQLMGRTVSPVRLDTPIRQEITGTLTEKILDNP